MSLFPMDTEQKQPVDVKSTVLSRIACENICPRARLWYRCRECGVWTLWLLTILLSAVAVAVSFFVIMHRQYALFEATHDSFLGFMFEVLPYLWLIVFVIAAGFAYYHFRHTKRGYRYSFFTITGATVVASLSGGLFFHYLGMSFLFDDLLGKYMPGMYVSQSKMEEKFWQQPEDGRLIVTLVSEPVPGEVALVTDVRGVEREIDITELFATDLELLRAGTQVRLLGRAMSGAGDSSFRACGVFPWLYTHMVPMEQFRLDREAAIARLHDHRDRAREEALAQFVTRAPEAAGAPLPAPPERACAEIAAVKRLRD